jgi:hypothetical protein
LAGGAILLVGGSASLLFRAGSSPGPLTTPLRVLGPHEYQTFAAAAARLCPGGDGAGGGWPSAQALGCAAKVDELLAGLHPKAAGEFRQLLRVFENAMTGLLTIGSPATFTRSSPELQDRRLEGWRHSRVALFRSGYQAMKRLAHATYYSAPETYALVGYPGPPVVPQLPQLPQLPEPPR